MKYKIIEEYLKSGLSVIPIIPKTKNAAIRWKEYQTRLPTPNEIHRWFTDIKNYEVAVIGGKVSGNLEIIDIDNHSNDAQFIFLAWKDLLCQSNPEVLEKLYIETTQSGGVHIIYKVEDEVGSNTKLAQRDINGKIETIIETRGEGGYALIYPSTNYSTLHGSLNDLQPLTPEEHEIIIETAKSFNEITKEPKHIFEKNYKDATSGERPGEEFNRTGDITDILLKHGWQLVHTEEKKEYWRRPGKKNGWSATFNYIPNKFYVFSSNCYPFENDRAYDKFSVFALLEHSGNFSKAAKDLAQRGYGSNGSKIPKQIDKIGPTHLQPQDTNHELLPLTEVGNAERFKRLFTGRVKYNHSAKRGKGWMIWNGTHWQIDTKDKILELGKLIAEDIKKEESLYLQLNDKKITTRFYNWVQTSQTERNIRASLSLAASMPEFATTYKDWDKDKYLVNFQNGTLNLQTMEFLPHSPGHMITRVIPINYNNKAKCERWESALSLYFEGNQRVINFVQKICGLSLCGAHLEEIIVFLYGTGKNGKSVFVNVLRHIFGEYAGVLPIETLLVQHIDDTKKSEIAKLTGKRFVVTTEVPIGKYLNEATTKLLTGGDPIVVRNLYEDFFVMQPQFILWIVGNHKPEIKGSDNGIWRRMALIPFRVTIPPELEKPQSVILSELLSEEEGILNWIVQGWKKYLDEGLQRPEEVDIATADYREDQDILNGFFNDKIEIGNEPEFNEKGSALYNAYMEWCEAQKEKPVGKKVFFRILEEKGFVVKKDRKGQKVFCGLRLAALSKEELFEIQKVWKNENDPF